MLSDLSKKIALPMLLLLIQIWSVRAVAAASIPPSGIRWQAITNRGSQTKTYDAKNFAELLASTLKDEKLGVSCKFKQDRGQAADDKTETVYIDCMVGELSVSTAPVTCSRNPKKPNLSASQSLYFDVHKLNVTVSCRVAEEADPKAPRK